MEDHLAEASMKSVEQSEICDNDTQWYVNRRYSNTYVRKHAHYAKQAL